MRSFLEKKMSVSEAKPARMDEDTMKPRKLLQSQGTFFLQLSAFLNAKLLQKAFGGLVFIYTPCKQLHNMISVFSSVTSSHCGT